MAASRQSSTVLATLIERHGADRLRALNWITIYPLARLGAVAG
jgi:hypothetical protein